jgi:hypothetical protein
MPFELNEFSSPVSQLLAAAPTCPLGPGSPVHERRGELAELSPSELVAPQPVTDQEMARAAIAGLWLRFNFLDESHTISQDLHSTTGSYWHAVMHRREPDYGNSKYWFQRVGTHPVFESLCAAARRLAGEIGTDRRTRFLAEQANWDPFAFVDVCQQAARDSTLRPLCEAIQQVEWELLFNDCYWRAMGK